MILNQSQVHAWLVTKDSYHDDIVAFSGIVNGINNNLIAPNTQVRNGQNEVISPDCP